MIRWISLIFLFASFSASGFDSDLMDKKSFTRHFVIALERAIPDAFIDPTSPLQVYVFTADGEESNLFLNDLYEDYVDAPSKLDSLVSKKITNFKAQQIILQSYASKEVLPVIKSRRFIEATKRQLKAEALEELPFYTKPISGDLYATFVFKDAPNKLLSFDELNKDRKNLYNLVEESATNLERHFNHYGANIQRVETQEKGRVYVLAVDEVFEASALLVSSLWSKKNFPVNGDLVAFVPNQGTIIVTGSRDKQGLKKAKILAFDSYQALEKPISIYGYRFQNGKWQRQSR